MSFGSDLRKFVVPELLFGVEARLLAGQYATNFGATRVLVVTDEGVMAAKWTQDVVSSLESAGLDTVLWPRVTPNPRTDEVSAGAEVFAAEGCNLIVAVGGGSPLDCAKGIGVVASNGGVIDDFEGVDRITCPLPPMIAIPTTGGTSADVSQFAIFLAARERRKFAIISKSVVPDVSLIDPQVLTTMDAELTAHTGLDALGHAVEAYLSSGSSPLTDLHALDAIRLITSYLEPSIADPSNVELRTEVMRGSLYAGLAFSNASLGAAHAMAHGLGGLLDLPHGECVAMLLEHVIAFNFAAVPDRCRHVALAMGVDAKGLSESELKKALSKRFREFRHAVAVRATLSERGVHRTDVPELTERALQDPCLVTNPRPASHRDIEVVYEEAPLRNESFQWGRQSPTQDSLASRTQRPILVSL